MDETLSPKKIMTVQDVSAYLKIPTSTIYELAAKGKIRGVKFGKHWRFLGEDILNYIHGIHTPRAEQDRRVSARLNTNLESEIHNLLPNKKEQSSSSVVCNISAGGVLLKQPLKDETKGHDFFAEGDPVQVSMTLSEQKLCLDGRVVHVQVQGKEAALGIKFRSISQADKEVIQTYVG